MKLILFERIHLKSAFQNDLYDSITSIYIIKVTSGQSTSCSLIDWQTERECVNVAHIDCKHLCLTLIMLSQIKWNGVCHKMQIIGTL